MSGQTDLPLSDVRAGSYAAVPFEVLAACHHEIQDMLGELRALTQGVAEHGVKDADRQTARRLHLFFATTAINHHLDEERHVFPALLRDGAATMVKLVQRLQMQHAWFEKHWVTLVPHLDALARGYRPDLDVFSRLIQQLTAMYEEHMTLEDSLAYPQAKAQLSPQDLRIMTREMAQRRHKSTHGQGPDELFDDDESS